ncbi:MAG: ABC transporter permease, partial [Spirochaetales bacterium]|nr:ABC transporter permease [Spirochaetales bacterium]
MSFKTVLYLGFRPFKPKKHGVKGVIQHTIIVVAIALLPLVVVLLVADGMIQGITNRYIETSSSHFRVFPRNEENEIETFELLKSKLSSNGDIKNLSIQREGAAVAVVGDVKRGIFIRGVDPDIMINDSGFAKYLTVEDGEFDLTGDSVVISSFLARKMDAKIGDEFRIITGKIIGKGKILPRISKYKIKGIVKTGYEELDKLWVFMPLSNSIKILPIGSSETFIGIKVSNPYSAQDQIYSFIRENIPSDWNIRSWDQLNRATFENFKTQEMSLTLIMGLIVIVAGINISSSLIMLVLEKRRDIAILKSMGLSPADVMGAYLLTGIIIGIIGTIAGMILGVFISVNINEIISIFENIVRHSF